MVLPPLQDCRSAQPTLDADGCHAVLGIAQLHLVSDGGENPEPRCAEGVADGARPSVDVHVLQVQLEAMLRRTRPEAMGTTANASLMSHSETSFRSRPAA